MDRAVIPQYIGDVAMTIITSKQQGRVSITILGVHIHAFLQKLLGHLSMTIHTSIVQGCSSTTVLANQARKKKMEKGSLIRCRAENPIKPAREFDF